MWTKKGKYGLKALIHLGGLPPGRSALSMEIAAAHGLPQKFLEAIMLELKHAGFVQSRKGKGGGYTLRIPPRDIRIGEVVRALEGPLAPIACASPNFYRRCDDCPDESICGVRMLTVDVRNAIADVLDNTTLEDVIARIGRQAALLESEPENRADLVPGTLLA
jgi:Rrf2 family protein